MIFPECRAAASVAILSLVCLFPSSRVFAQAPAGPMAPTHPLPPPPPRPPARKKPELESRKTLAGFWKLNNDESDDPGKKLEEARQTKADSGAGGGAGGGGGRVGVGFPPYPGGGGNGPNGGGGRRMGGEDNGTSERIQEQVRPDYSQSISLMDAEVDVTNDNGHKLVYYTDGRKIQKLKDASFQAVSAHWDGTRLVTDEKGPQGRKMSRTLELSADGKHFSETWRIENGKAGTIIIRYIYDSASEYQ